ncbi:MAG: exodeoxyribonuclease VII small subunit [Syntrophales bacterium]|nr:exodeoxyribonuclease VII small subunit [Syntrophales bacterium]
MAKEKFEDALSRLEEIVHRLERGEMTLEESLKAFEEGIKLARFCAKKLEDAQKRIDMLISSESGEIFTVPLTGGEEESEKEG